MWILYTICVDTLPYIRVDIPPFENTPVLLEAVNKAGETPLASLAKRVSSQMRLFPRSQPTGGKKKKKENVCTALKCLSIGDI